jgi:Uma2 family endonuclease
MKHDTLAPWAERVPDTHPMTADDLLRLDDDEWQYELVEGTLVRVAPTGLEHFDITRKLFRVLDRHVEDNKLGIVTLPDTGFRLDLPGSGDTVLSPDIAFVGTQKVLQLPAPGTPERKKYLPVAPDLVVEVASPDQYRPEMAEKAKLYLASGVWLVWIVWPAARQVDVWEPGRTSRRRR